MSILDLAIGTALTMLSAAFLLNLWRALARSHARRVSVVYLALTMVAIAAVWMSGLAPLDALLYALPAISTGGFAPSDQSLAGLPRTTIATLSLICVAAAVSFPLYARLPRRGLRSLKQEPELIALLGAILITALLLSAIASLTSDLPWPQLHGSINVHDPVNTAMLAIICVG